jgi:branched-subunit amino acid ABC-type transport system permease component
MTTRIFNFAAGPAVLPEPVLAEAQRDLLTLPGVTIEGRYTFTGTHIMAAVLAVAIAGLLYLLLYRTRIGKAIRAVASNREAAELNGIPTTQVLSFAFGLGVTLAGVSGADRHSVSLHGALG